MRRISADSFLVLIRADPLHSRHPRIYFLYFVGISFTHRLHLFARGQPQIDLFAQFFQRKFFVGNLHAIQKDGRRGIHF